MPTDNIKFGDTKLYFKSNEDDEIKELEKIKELKAENIEVCDDDAVDAMRYYLETVEDNGYSGELTLSKETGQRLLKIIGENRITRKRFIKLLMGYGMQRNNANLAAEIIHNKYLHYSLKTVQLVIKWEILKRIGGNQCSIR